MIGKKLLHYRITEKLGEGGMGVVYRAHDERLGRDVAIKFLPHPGAVGDAERKRFHSEARAAAALNHPNIASVHAIEESEGEIFIVMEYIDGPELRDLIADGVLPLEKAVDVATQVAGALKEAHARGVVHRDIKSANIMVTDGGQVKITDFGLAKMRGASRVTQTGMTVGTADYMSPEQVRGEEVDQRSDIWSFGVVLYELLTGERPFQGDYEQAVMYQILNGVPRAPSAIVDGLPAQADQIVEKALARDPDDRYQRMDDVLRDLRTLTTATRGSTSHDDTPRTPSVEKEPPALAVLPFTSIRSDPETDFLGFALADQIIGALTYVDGVLVRPSSAVRKYQGQSVDTRVAASELHADFVLAGYYLREADAIRLNVELVSAETDRLVWREPIQVRYENVFKLQDIVSEKVLNGLKVQFSTGERERMQADVPRNPLAYEYYLRAVSYPGTLDGNRLAIEMARESLARDPGYAPAHAELGFRLFQEATYAMLGVEGHRQAEEALRKALSINPNLLTALWHLSLYHVEIGKPEEAAKFIERMFRVMPGCAMGHWALGYLYRYAGLLEESVRELDQALALDARNPRFRSAGFTYVYSGDYQKAFQTFALDGMSTLSIAWMGMSLFYMGERAKALEYFDRAVAMEPEGFVGMRHTGIALFIRGDIEGSLRAIRRLENANPADSDSEHWYLIGTAYGLLGDAAGCARALDRTVKGGFFNFPAMVREPMLDPVREDPEVRAVLALAREKHESFKKTWASRTWDFMK